MSHRHEIDSILTQVQDCSPEDRQALVMGLLRPSRSGPTPPPRDTLSLAKAVASLVIVPPPSDEKVRQWVDEHRMAKYGRGLR